jgi:hypothetical protein
MPKATYERNGREIDWVVPKSLVTVFKDNDIRFALSTVMEDNGYHPAGYGSPFNIREEGENYLFQCWASCD